MNSAPSTISNVEYAHIPHLSHAEIPTLQNDIQLPSPNNGNRETLTGFGTSLLNAKLACDEFDQLIKNMAQVRVDFPC